MVEQKHLRFVESLDDAFHLCLTRLEIAGVELLRDLNDLSCSHLVYAFGSNSS